MPSDADMISRDDARPPFFVGLDLGGTNIKIGVVDDDGRTLAYVSLPTDAIRGPDDAAERMGQAVLSVIVEAGLQPTDVTRVGLGSPGTMDIPSGMLIEPPNLPGWDHFPIRDRVAQHCGLPVTLVNDAGAAAFGEYWVGRGRLYHSIVLLTLGTGVGGGIIIGGLSIDGEHSAGSELGHVIIDCADDARMCPCGRRGHLEAYCSATAVVQRAEEALAAGDESSLRERISAGEPLTTLMMAQQAEQGDALCEEVIMETARLLGVGIASFIHTIDPAAVVLAGAMTFGGSKTDLGRRFLERLREEVRRRVLGSVTDRTVIDFASLGSDAGYIGAAGIARTIQPETTATDNH